MRRETENGNVFVLIHTFTLYRMDDETQSVNHNDVTPPELTSNVDVGDVPKVRGIPVFCKIKYS